MEAILGLTQDMASPCCRSPSQLCNGFSDINALPLFLTRNYLFQLEIRCPMGPQSMLTNSLAKVNNPCPFVPTIFVGPHCLFIPNPNLSVCSHLCLSPLFSVPNLFFHPGCFSVPTLFSVPRVLFSPWAHGHCPQEILKSHRK